MSRVVFRKCPSCGNDNSALPSTEYGDENWPIKACNGCGFVYMEIAPVYDRLVDEFAWEKTSAAETERRESKEPIKQFISFNIKSFRRRWIKRNKLTRLVRRYP